MNHPCGTARFFVHASTRARCFVLFLATLLTVFRAAGSGAEVGFEMRAEGRSFWIQAPGLEMGEMHFGAEIEIDGQRHFLDSREGKPVGAEAFADRTVPYGKTQAEISTVRFEELGIDLMLRIDRFEETPCLLINAGIRNLGDRSVTLIQLRMIDRPKNNNALAGTPWTGVGSLQDWILTAQDSGVLTKTFAELEKPIAVREEFGAYRREGAGVFIGPVGKPAAFVHGEVSRDIFFVESEMFPAVLPAGDVRWGQQLGLFFEPPRLAKRRWVEWVARTHGARTSLGALDGWMDVFSEFRSTEKDVFSAIDFVHASRGHLRPQAIVLDRSLESLGQTPEEISKQLPRFVERISAIHSTPGIRLSLNDNLSSPEENLRTVRGTVDKGFRLLKLIYNFAKAKPDGQNLTLFERHRKHFEAIRSAAGESTYLLSCMIRSKRAGLGLIDSTRSGPNIERRGLRDVIKDSLWAFPLNRRWYAVDNDVGILATELRDVSPLAGGWPITRTWLSMVGLSCGNAFTADHWFLPKFQPYIRNFEILQPPAREETEILDLGTSTEWSRLVGRVARPWGSWTVALLWNSSEWEDIVSLDFAEIGGQPGSRFAVWSFWDNAYLGVVEESYTTRFLAASASEHLVFTELPRDLKKPILIGSNFHIYCGAAEIKNVTALDSGMAIELTDAGASSGSLFVYSKIRPLASSATGCEITGIESAGENAWRIDIRNRAFGTTQLVELNLPLPAQRQAWFWALLALLAASLGFGVWKYFDWLRSKNALELSKARHEERARIARDLHDEIGSGLSHISMLGEKIGSTHEAARSMAQSLQQTSTESLRRLNEIVWAVNPERDYLPHLADYLQRFAENYLANSDIRLRVEIPDDIPPLHLSSKSRLTLYLATREAFRNAVRHGRPSLITLQISIAAGTLMIAIGDNGCGFDPATTDSSGNGLVNMRARLKEIGGTCTIDSAPGAGTKVTFSLPLLKPNRP